MGCGREYSRRDPAQGQKSKRKKKRKKGTILNVCLRKKPNQEATIPIVQHLFSLNFLIPHPLSLPNIKTPPILPNSLSLISILSFVSLNLSLSKTSLTNALSLSENQPCLLIRANTLVETLNLLCLSVSFVLFCFISCSLRSGNSV